MGLVSYGRFQELRKRKGYAPHRTGYVVKVDNVHIGTYINRLNARMNVARSFRGIELEGFASKTVNGYDAFLQVVLTHSVLERFVRMYGKSSKVSGWEELISPYHPQEVIRKYFELDNQSRLFDFLCQHLDKKRDGEAGAIEQGLTACRTGESKNVAFISGAVRHIFAHGHLTANANGITPARAYKACTLISDFLLDFMDAEFTKSVNELEKRIDEKEAS